MAKNCSPRFSGGFGEFVKTIGLALLISLVVRTVAAETYTVPTGSMIPTLLVGDTLIASKFPYGYSRYSSPIWAPAFEGRILGAPPERGDVVVFRLPREPSTTYVKRVIGLPGDRVQMRAGLLVLNGKAVPRRFVGTTETEFGAVSLPVQEYAETLPNGREHLILKLSDDQPYDDTPEFVVPAAHYFMMGDNRDNSLDSRIAPANGGVGFVPFENLVGRADVLAYSREVTTPWWKLWALPASFRGDRFLKAVS